ncbi:hypothetical protein CC1G_03348 [Coprinopsis cinerea okayama7|uniref:F-box domain-containing protein n=1 Tax=Coprinopsis cinerea (strain Okayama-7 / 130 / ATCC MYA-4618 / FGSC 9003) TaxID=240176 RepID=A8NQX2_COPC7|nr:hypothetical protein CC1G_03348 [Coprinopsis cinerea okayama7\|eukprot:XP_001835566.2 hypothetical protein CC1G_03348 [Coprinopsis cinerea okayama7\
MTSTPQSLQNHCSLLSLPNELLHKIFAAPELPAKDVLRTALVCRKLQDICTISYLHSAGIPSPEHECILKMDQLGRFPWSQYQHTLQALCFAPSITKVQTLSASFPFACIWSDILPQLQTLERFIKRLKHVSSVTLAFRGYSFNQSRNPTVSEEDVFERWSLAVSNLLNTIVQKGCTFLSVEGLTSFTDRYESVKLSRQSFIFSQAFERLAMFLGGDGTTQLNNILSGPHWKFRRRGPPGSKIFLHHLSNEARLATTLKHITIASSSLLVPPLLQWTLDLLEASPIESIAFRECCNHPDVDWAILQTLFANSAAKVLSLELGDFPRQFILPKFNSLINIFSGLTFLSFQQYPFPDSRFSSSDVTIPAFHHLTHLRAHFKWIQASGVVIIHPPPTLISLTVVWVYQSDSHRPEFPDLVQTLSALSDKLVPTHESEMRFSSVRPSTATVSLEVINRLLAPLDHHQLTDLAHNTRCITHLLIDFRPRRSTPELATPSSEEVVHAIQFYLHTFQELRSFTLKVWQQETRDGKSIGGVCVGALRAVKHGKLEWFEVNGVQEEVGV